MPGVSGVTDNDNLISPVASYIYKETEVNQKNTEVCGVEQTNIEIIKDDETGKVLKDEYIVEENEIVKNDVIVNVESVNDLKTIEDVECVDSTVEENKIENAVNYVEYSDAVVTEYVEESECNKGDFDCDRDTGSNEIAIENNGDKNILKSDEQTKQTAVEKPDDAEQKQPDSSIKRCFTNIEILLLKLYEKVFDKNNDFKPTYSRVVNDLLSFIAHKSAEIGAFGKFRAVFNTDETLLIGTSRGDNYIPYIIKLTAVIDKNNKTDFTNIVTKEITKILLGLLSGKEDAAQTVTGAMSDIYSYVLSTGVKLM